MENKETGLEVLNEICKECNRASVYDKTYGTYPNDKTYGTYPNDKTYGTCPNYNKIYDDLKELEQYKEIMGTPIQDIMKRLKVLEILKTGFVKEGNVGRISLSGNDIIYLQKEKKNNFNKFIKGKVK